MLIKKTEANHINKNSNKFKKLFLGIIFDLIGMLSYSIPFFAEYTDVVWAPISALIIVKMYHGKTGKVAAILSFIEEAFPFIDVIPTFTLTWIYVYLIKKEV
ncbi:hypothetical protein [uncultured Flavobacterium sp.]|uniref:hypothetical protein n=1 Tax=uncultured Flavobacterium sp. TaxID=165435 RepID=UPI0030CA582D|tara:strand:+ start:619 stop:924 length:306 start_codon:yes stop_codon:yes gene_type:complete